MSHDEPGSWAWVADDVRSSTPTSQPAAAAVTLGVELAQLAANVELLRRLSVNQLDNMAQAVGLATRIREALDTLEALDAFLAAQPAAK